MKKFIKWLLLGLTAFIVLTVTTLALILFFKPTILINPKVLDFVLTKTKVLKSWSWEDAHFSHEWKKWNERVFKGHFKNFCFVFDQEAATVDACLEEISWNFNFLYNFGEGLKSVAIDPIKVRSSKFNLKLKPTAKKQAPKGPPLAVWDYWKMLWSDLIPDTDVVFKKIKVTHNAKTYEFDLTLFKAPKHLRAEALGFELNSTFEKLEVTAPKKYPFPKDLPTAKPLFLRNMKLTALMKKSGIPIKVTGGLETIELVLDSKISLPLQSDLTSIAFQRRTLLDTSARIRLPEVKKNLYEFGPRPYHNLPAPLSNMDGSIGLDIKTVKPMDSKSVVFEGYLSINLESPQQFFVVNLKASAPFDLETRTPGAIAVEVDFKKVALMLPRLSRKSLPPQFFPDKRIQSVPYRPVDPKVKLPGKFELTINPQALGDRALHLRTNLLDEVLRLNFDLVVSDGTVQKGFVETLPLKTKVFKRPIRLQKLRINFNHPLEPVIISTIQIPLPEYKITIELEGPLSKPRHAFSSDPPLPKNDIFAVLLFGRPLADLDPDDKTAASKTNQILSQGILSLSVLYFLAGSSVEYVGYDPNSQNATAQIGLGHKNSLRVGGNQSGVNSTAVRRSLGKGWYIDTSVQNSTDSDVKNYGVLLERIIAY
ncbi:MAG TPA: translocation/assembly module TamB domain-containing protein [Bacteriovoracaceae bacterium]|nr:translocation/assembly module TamB domain-containing protein [Bacteriovoracaceae bacterium]